MILLIISLLMSWTFVWSLYRTNRRLLREYLSLFEKYKSATDTYQSLLNRAIRLLERQEEGRFPYGSFRRF